MPEITAKDKFLSGIPFEYDDELYQYEQGLGFISKEKFPGLFQYYCKVSTTTKMQAIFTMSFFDKEVTHRIYFHKMQFIEGKEVTHV